jgi:hypothetical protein
VLAGQDPLEHLGDGDGGRGDAEDHPGLCAARHDRPHEDAAQHEHGARQHLDDYADESGEDCNADEYFSPNLHARTLAVTRRLLGQTRPDGQAG